MSVASEIFEELWNKTTNYKGIGVNFFGVPRFKKTNNITLRSTLSQLKKKGYIVNNQNKWYLTPTGTRYFKKKQDSLKQFDFKFPQDAPKNLLVMFDIPQERKGEREWLRWHLKKFSYRMIQKSVWVGPSPLPKEFVDYLKNIKLYENLKTFKLAKGYKMK